MSSPVLGDIYDINGRLREYDPELSLQYDGDGRWSVLHTGRQGKPYTVLSIGPGCGNRWPKGDREAPEITCPDMRIMYLIRDADLDAKGGADQAVRDMEAQEWMRREASKAQLAQHTEDVARDMHPFFKREVEGAPDFKIFNPVAKPEVA
jgi:hypothetical protein